MIIITMITAITTKNHYDYDDVFGGNDGDAGSFLKNLQQFPTQKHPYTESCRLYMLRFVEDNETTRAESLDSKNDSTTSLKISCNHFKLTREMRSWQLGVTWLSYC